MDDVSMVITALTPVVVPLIVGFLKKVVKVPAPLRPGLAIVLGAAVDLLNVYVTGHGVGYAWGTTLGAVGIVVREFFVAFKKALEEP